jgi:hypothetical protein
VGRPLRGDPHLPRLAVDRRLPPGPALAGSGLFPQPARPELLEFRCQSSKPTSLSSTGSIVFAALRLALADMIHAEPIRHRAMTDSSAGGAAHQLIRASGHKALARGVVSDRLTSSTSRSLWPLDRSRSRTASS